MGERRKEREGGGREKEGRWVWVKGKDKGEERAGRERRRGEFTRQTIGSRVPKPGPTVFRGSDRNFATHLRAIGFANCLCEMFTHPDAGVPQTLFSV